MAGRDRALNKKADLDSACHEICQVTARGKGGRKNHMLPQGRELTPEESLLIAIVSRAVMDAREDYMGNEAGWQCQAGREARKWFRDHSSNDFGWAWIIERLGLTDRIVKRIEQRAFLLGRY